MTPGLPVESLVRQPASGANELIRGYPVAGVRSTAYSEAVVTPVRPQRLDVRGLQLHARAC